MKKSLLLTLIALVSVSTVFASGAKESEETNKIVIGATPEPHAAMLNLVKDDLEAQGYELEIIEFTDYVTPNEALESGEIDANFFQHLPYLETFNKEHNTHLVSAGGIHVEPIALYSKTVSSIDELEDGATIAIPNDPTNEGRALLLLESANLITLKDDAGLEATPFDIKDNPNNFKFQEIEAATLPRIIGDVDAAIINGNYAIPAGLIATQDGLLIEGAQSPYVNVIAIKEGNESAKIDALVKALKSDKVASWVQEQYPNGEVVLVE
ncbi:MAG: MetQ/NlpA family ABC transporter substrate-binding protein [Sphaerochaetaceae bacterium]|jgi:D-methionine transport system substrate-binding protein|nr:MetQ/NlpA family ABC transporter substrate-binding protein [Sphaerochaetaceae bacterium]MDC7236825.1 MetQ/NlpA family ABC transporter substrate-binding protein [Sphaerochaetaceae bacterium]MDC7244083.1 MetQ/NlpA family ABC transporter substrate-binding protein [Sphaerochaetaceae bacterium]